jgi:hypothetical protein
MTAETRTPEPKTNAATAFLALRLAALQGWRRSTFGSGLPILLAVLTMDSSSPQSPVPGWYPDPDVGSGLRYWDGQRWTEQRACGAGGISNGTRPPRTLGVAFLLAVVVAIFYRVFLSVSWPGCSGAGQNDLLAPVVFAPICFLVYGWRRGQKPLIVVAQAALVLVLTGAACVFLVLGAVSAHQCNWV